MAKILQIETATQTCSVALSVDGELIALKEETATQLHAKNLTLFIQDVMQQASLSYQHLDAIAVSKGPGSYTGLRIGVSTAKGLSYALDKPLIAIDTLKMMANGFLVENASYEAYVCPMIDARRMEVYTTLYNSTLQIINPTCAKIIDESSFEVELSANQITFIGDGALKCLPFLKNDNAVFSELNFNSAAYMTALAAEAFDQQKFEDVAYFEPYYLKDFMFTAPKKKG